MRLLLTAAFLFALASKPSNSQECAIPGLDSYFDRKENASSAVLNSVQTIATSIVPGLSSELGNESTNTSDLYDALTTTLNVTSTSNFQTFTAALEEITDAYFLACYGEQNQQPTQDDLIPELQNLLMLLDTFTMDNADEELPIIRSYFGEISCVIDTYGYDNLLPTNQSPTEPGGGTSPTEPGGGTSPTEPGGGTIPPTSSPGPIDCSDLSSITVQAFYVCITPIELQPIFGLGYDDIEGPPLIESKRCVGFVVDTTGSMGAEIVEVRNNIKNFIASEQAPPACYVLVDFNDYGAPSPSDNVGIAKVYDPKIDYESEVSSLVRTGGLPVKGIQDLNNDVDLLYANGGGDCPEYGMAGILKVLEAISSVEGLILPQQGNLHHIITLTDASAKDDYLVGEVLDAAIDARATVHFFYSGGGCGGTFGNYEVVRTTTGGIAVTDFADFDALSEFIQLYSETVESSSGTTRRKRSGDDIFSESAASHSVYVNYLTDNLAILAQTTQSQVIVSKPDGQQIFLPVSGILALYTDEEPMPGLWTISVSLGTLQVVISAPILLELEISYTTTDENGELVPTQDIPYACDTGTILATSGQLDKISLDYPLYLNLLDSTGSILQQAELTECEGFVTGAITFPNAPLVFFQLQGHDIGANPFTKTFSDYDVTFRPPNLQMSLLNFQTITVNPGNTSFSKLELHYNQSRGVEVNVQLTVTSSSSDLVPYFINIPQSVRASEKVYAVLETQASFNVLPGTSGYSVTTSVTETCTGSTVNLISLVIPYQPVPLSVANTTQVSNERDLKVSWQVPDISSPNDIWQYRIHLDYDNGTFSQVDVDSTVQVYILYDLQPYQQIYVTVEARGVAGETLAKTAQLRFRSREDVPGPVVEVIFTVSNNNTAWIQWDPPSIPNGVILYYVVRLWDVADVRELNLSYVDALQERIVTYEHLEEYIRYEVTVTGATSEGLGESQQRQFYTTEGEPNDSPQNVRIRPITTTSANISWDPPPIQNRRGFIIRYDITIGYNEPSGQHRLRYYYNLGEDNTSIIVEDLPQYSRVSAEVSSATEQGSGPVSPPTTGIIELPPSAPLSLSGSPAGSSAVLITWLPPESPNGILLGYTVYFRTEDSTNQVEQEFQEWVINLYELEDENSPTAQIDGLTSPAAHSFVVTAFNSAGNGENSTQISVTLNDNSWIIILCGVMGGVLVIIIIIIAVVACCCCCCSCCMNKTTKRKHGVFEVFQNEEDTENRSATNPVYEHGETENIYEDMEKAQVDTKLHPVTYKEMAKFEEFHKRDEPAMDSATNPVFGIGETDGNYTDVDQLISEEKPTEMEYRNIEAGPQKKQNLRKQYEKAMEAEREEWKLRKVPPKKTEAQLEMERILKTVPDKIDHYEDIITRMGGSAGSAAAAADLITSNPEASAAAAAALMTTNPADYANVSGNVVVSVSTQQTQ